MSIKLEKPRIKERCSEILALRKFKDLLDRSQELNKMNEDSFLELLQLHNEMKNKSQDPSEFLQLMEVEQIINNYCKQKFDDIEIQDEKIAQYLKLIARSETDPGNDNTKLFMTLLTIEKQIQNLILHSKVQSTQIIEQNEELKGSLNKVLGENAYFKGKFDELNDDFGISKAQSDLLIEDLKKENAKFVTKIESLLFKNEEDINEIEKLKTQSKEILDQNVHLKENLDRVLMENSKIKADSSALLIKNEESKNDLVATKGQSIQLAQKLSTLQEKLNRVLDENELIKLKFDSILSQLVEMKVQSDIILQNSNTLSQENLLSQSKLDQLPKQQNFIMSHSLSIDKIKKVEINKKIARLHITTINKIINYDNNTKFITCSNDTTIIIRNCLDNVIFKSFTINHKEVIWDILLLSDGRLATSSADKTIKIWNLTNGNCEQTLIGHCHCVYCLLKLPNSILLSGSQDSSIGVWDVSQQNQKELQFYHQVKNDEQQQEAYCMILVNLNELAVSSRININIYSFDNAAKKSFYIIKILKGHNDWVVDIKLMKNSNDLLVSCSGDRDCRLWSISQENCLRVFKGHISKINSIQMLSEKIFVSASAEIIFWNIESSEAIHVIKLDQSGKMINSLMKNDENELFFAGQHDFIGLIKI